MKRREQPRDKDEATLPTARTPAMTDDGAASTGVGMLDTALDGLYWGDNVVWETEEEAAAQPFYAAIAGERAAYDFAAYVSLTRPPEEIRAAYPGFEVIDARATGSLGRPAPLLQAIYERCDRADRSLLLFDPLDAMAGRWGTDTARAFFVRCCPHLLEVGAIAYWSVGHGPALASLRREIHEVTQCVLTLSEGRLRIAKAEARGPGVEGSVFRNRVEDGRPALEAAPAAARLGTALRAVRMQRDLSQSELARLLGISPSAVSQAERGRRGLSLETLLDACTKLDLTLDELLRGDVNPGYRLARRHDPRRRADGRPLPLIDDRQAGLRAYLLTLAPRQHASPHLTHKGVELVAVVAGLVQVQLDSGRPVLRRGETLLAERSAVLGWRNLGESDATLFWILRDG
jgi:transcriptional regulator with XRE-family HTH domain